MSILIGIISGVVGFAIGAFVVIVKIADIMDEHKED